MKITEVKIKLMTDHEPVKAFASITFDNCFVVHDLRIIKKSDKTIVAMPSKKLSGGNRFKDTYKDIAHPINSQMRSSIEQAIFTKYNQAIDSQKNSS